jgi:superfamily II DNA/RNA helicase
MLSSSPKTFSAAFYSDGKEQPSALEQKAILPLLRGRDLICQAQSGTGKTTTLAIGVLQRVDIKIRSCQALILDDSRAHPQACR